MKSLGKCAECPNQACLAGGGKVSLRLTRGDVVLTETCGGSGFGPPAERPAVARETDRREGYV